MTPKPKKTATPPIVGIVPTLSTSENAILMANRYAEAIVSAGGAPLMLPLCNDVRVYESLFPLIDGFLLTGGQDISPKRYSSSEHSEKLGELTPEREEIECLVLNYANTYDTPVLGICRGMQVINAFFGGTLYQDLAEQFNAASIPQAKTDIKHWQDGRYDIPSHTVSIVRASKLGDILDVDELNVNSIHHQGVKELAPSLDAVAYSPDGLIEAVEMRDRSFILGVQWHPEFFAGNERMSRIFAALIRECSNARESRATRRINDFSLRIEREDIGEPWPVVRFADCI